MWHVSGGDIFFPLYPVWEWLLASLSPYSLVTVAQRRTVLRTALTADSNQD